MIAAGLHGLDAELELEPPLEGNAYASDKPHVPTTLAEARALFAGSDVARAGVRRGGRRPLPQLRPRRARGLRGLRDRLGARTGVRTAVSQLGPRRLRTGPVHDRVRGDARAPRHRDQARPAAARTRLPPERDLCEQLGIARSTLRQALTALVQSGHLHAVRGRGGGTFVADTPLAVASPSELVDWRERCDVRSRSSAASRSWRPSARTRRRSAARRPGRRDGGLRGRLRRLPPRRRPLPRRAGRGHGSSRAGGREPRPRAR